MGGGSKGRGKGTKQIKKDTQNGVPLDIVRITSRFADNNILFSQL